MQGVLEEVSLLQEITEACRGAVRAFVEDRTDSKGRVSQDSLNNFARSIGFGQQPWTKALKVTTFPRVSWKVAVRKWPPDLASWRLEICNWTAEQGNGKGYRKT